ncbi:hypothetical protein [Streptomyces sp. MI02-7b]|uniref:hypothetical protein n=1 Tax=Streptomyces sp. MI02-7b TaxID=462941 RepID=UPI0029BC235E|nr:hypothetical protein [Streptomyces sp. MI02-7b]MDX3074628.1 hypothetical protein [Streptomyces sp. MI02-7b]
MTTPMALDAALAGASGRDDYPDHTYTYLFCDLLTDQLLAELPLSGVQYSTALNGIGTLRALVPYNDETLLLDPENATTPGRTAVYVDRDGVIVWGGVLWTRTIAKGGKSIQASTFESYFQRRYVRTTLSTDTSLILDTDYVPDGQRLYADQRFIVWCLFRYAAMLPGGDIRIDTSNLSGSGGATGVGRNISYFGYERPEIYAAIQSLAGAEDGFDWGIDVGWNPVANNVAPTRYRRARLWFPQRGRSADESGLVFTKGGPAGNILDFDWPEDGTSIATDETGLGAGEGEAKLIASQQSADMLASGWPLLEDVQTYPDVVDLAQLQGLANAGLNARSRASVQPWFDVVADGDPAFGSYSVGDSALFVIDPEPRMPYGLEVELRITGIDNAARRGPETVRLTCAAV